MALVPTRYGSGGGLGSRKEEKSPGPQKKETPTKDILSASFQGSQSLANMLPTMITIPYFAQQQQKNLERQLEDLTRQYGTGAQSSLPTRTPELPATPAPAATPEVTTPTTTETSAAAGGPPARQEVFTAPTTSPGEMTSAGLVRRGTQDAVSSIDSAISEIRGIMTQSLVDPSMAALVYQFMDRMNAELQKISDELAGWYQKLGTQQDLGLQQAVQILREEIEYQKAQLAEELNARGLLQSGIMAEAEARLRRGGLDQAQQLVANRLSELQGIILQSITSLAQTRMASLTDIYGRGLTAMTSLATSREATRGQAMSALGQLMADRARVQQTGAVDEASAVLREQQMAQERWLNEQKLAQERWLSEQSLRLQEAQQRAQQGLWGAQADYYRAQSELMRQPQPYTSDSFATLVTDTLNAIESGNFTQENYDYILGILAQNDPTVVSQYEHIVNSFLKARRQTLPRSSSPTATTTTQSLIRNYLPNYSYMLPNFE